jgi:hypothetical protein
LRRLNLLLASCLFGHLHHFHLFLLFLSPGLLDGLSTRNCAGPGTNMLLHFKCQVNFLLHSPSTHQKSDTPVINSPSPLGPRRKPGRAGFSGKFAKLTVVIWDTGDLLGHQGHAAVQRAFPRPFSPSILDLRSSRVLAMDFLSQRCRRAIIKVKNDAPESYMFL